MDEILKNKTKIFEKFIIDNSSFIIIKSMRKILLTLSTLFFLSFSLFAKAGYEINVKVDGYAEKEMFLAYHYGEKQHIKDTVQANDAGVFTFKGDEALKGGVYIVVLAPDNRTFEVLINDGQQHFPVETKWEDLVPNMQFKGSDDNQLYYDYLRYIGGKIEIRKKLVADLEAAKDENTKAEVQKKIDKLINEVKEYQMDLVEKNPETLTSTIIKPGFEIEMPKFEGDEKSVSMQKYRYFKNHYFDFIDLSDERVLRTPFLYQRVTFFEEKLTHQHPDSIAISIDYLLEKMKPSEETYKFYLIHFLNKYAKSKIVGMDAVYVHLAKNYYCNGKAPWTEEEQLGKICDNARRLEPVLLGKKARPITTRDRNGQSKNLFDVKSDYTILYFWAPDCGHCKKMTPFLIDFHEKWKNKGVTVFTICKPKSGDFTECWDYIDEKKDMEKMIHTYDPSQRAQRYYNVRSTPMMFILDKDKKIVMKGIGADQLEETMQQIIKRAEEMEKNK